MRLKAWHELPINMQNEAVRPYYESLYKKGFTLFIKRGFDIVVSAVMLLVLLPIFVALGVWIKMDSQGAVFYRQVRVTQYGRTFRIFKFRTMVHNADVIGTAVTVNDDMRITKAGHILRRSRLDEVPQLLNILVGDMTFVGARPEVPKYVECYTDEMVATLLLPAGVTSFASIAYKDEMQLLTHAGNADEAYVQNVLPEKMKYNLESLRTLSLHQDIVVLLKTGAAVIF